MTKTVYIAATDEHIAARVGSQLETAGVQVRLFSAVERLLEWLEEELPDVVVVEDPASVPDETLNNLFVDIPTVVIGAHMPLPQRLHYFQLGAHDVVSFHQYPEETTAAVVQNLLFRLLDLTHIRYQNLTTGNLEIFSLQEIFENAFVEGKSLIIKISLNDWSTTVRIGMGHILSVTPAHPEEHPLDTLLKTFQLPAGSFIIRKFEMKRPEKSAFPSIAGILTEAEYQRREFQKVLDAWGEKNPALEINEKALKKFKPDSAQTLLLDTIRRHPLLREAVIMAPGNLLQNLHQVQQLKDAGVIHFVGQKPMEQEVLLPEDVQFLKQHVFPENVTFGKFIVVGLPTSGKSELIRTFAGLNQAPLKQVQSLDFTRIRLNESLQLALFGVSIDEHFQPILEKISEGVQAIIFLVDYNSPERFEYTKYLVHSILNTYDVHFVVGVTHIEGDADTALQDVRNALDIPEPLDVVAVNPTNFGEVRRLLYNLKRMPHVEAEEET